MYIVAVQAPKDKKIFNKVKTELQKVAYENQVWLDSEFLFKIDELDWDKIAEICLKYTLNGTVLIQSN